MLMSERMAVSEPARRLELLTGAERRTWSVDGKAAIVAESDGPGTSVSAVARRHGLSALQLLTCLRLVRQAKRQDDWTTLRFVLAMLSVGAQESATTEASSVLCEQRVYHGIEVEIAGVMVRFGAEASRAQIIAVI